MSVTITSVSDEDRTRVIDIFNYYVEHSFAAFPENRLPYEAFALFMTMSKGYPFIAAKDASGRFLGFAMLRPHNPLPTFAHTAELSCFISPEQTGKGIGGRLLSHLESQATKNGITILLVAISSLNPGSIRFHQRNGFSECGRFHGICRKNETAFDVVWMEKALV